MNEAKRKDSEEMGVPWSYRACAANSSAVRSLDVHAVRVQCW